MFTILTIGWLSVAPSLEHFAISKNDDVMFVPRLRLFIENIFTLQICILIQYRNSEPKNEMETAADKDDENTFALLSLLLRYTDA